MVFFLAIRLLVEASRAGNLWGDYYGILGEV